MLKQAFWKVVQFSVFTAVMFSNIRYQWTPNGYAAGVVALLATLFVTAIPIMIGDIAALIRRLSRVLGLSHGAPMPVIEPRHIASPQTARLEKRG